MTVTLTGQAFAEETVENIDNSSSVAEGVEIVCETSSENEPITLVTENSDVQDAEMEASVVKIEDEQDSSEISNTTDEDSLSESAGDCQDNTEPSALEEESSELPEDTSGNKGESETEPISPEDKSGDGEGADLPIEEKQETFTDETLPDETEPDNEEQAEQGEIEEKSSEDDSAEDTAKDSGNEQDEESPETIDSEDESKDEYVSDETDGKQTDAKSIENTETEENTENDILSIEYDEDTMLAFFNDAAAMNIANDIISVTVTVHDDENNDIVLSGGEILLERYDLRDGWETVEAKISDEDGKAIWTNLELNTMYRVSEVTPPNWYSENAEANKLTFVLQDGSAPITVRWVILEYLSWKTGISIDDIPVYYTNNMIVDFYNAMQDPEGIEIPETGVSGVMSAVSVFITGCVITVGSGAALLAKRRKFLHC